MRIKLYGIQRSGTNYVERLLRDNYDCKVLVSELGSKHDHCMLGQYPARSCDCALVVVKSLHAWLVSMWRYCQVVGDWHPHARPWPLFLVSPLGLRAGEDVVRWHATPAWAWRWMYHSWLTAAESSLVPFRFVAYEHLLTPQAAELELTGVGDAPRLRRLPTGWKHPAGKMSVHAEDTKRPFDGTYYSEHRYLAHYQADDLRVVDLQTDHDLVAVLGYDRVQVPGPAGC